MERARAARLTRHQHILLRLGEWTAYAEAAGCLARRAALAAEGRLNEKANMRFDPQALATISRIFAREAALKVRDRRLALGDRRGRCVGNRITSLEAALGLQAIHRVQAGLWRYDQIGDVLYGRVESRWQCGVGQVVWRALFACRPSHKFWCWQAEAPAHYWGNHHARYGYRAIAIVGVGAVLPMLRTSETFWENVKGGVTASAT
jgi:hypothetical protein